MNMKDDRHVWLPFLGLFLLVVVLWAGSWYLIATSACFTDWGERGTFGDMFGAVNALFSGLAFAGVIYAIMLQRKELLLQRRELEFTRAELEGQKIQLEKQNRTSHIQRFENTFFQLLGSFSRLIEAIDVSDSYRGPRGGPLVGRSAFRMAYRKFKSDYDQGLQQHHDCQDVAIAYREFYGENHRHFGHFFRNLYHLLHYVDASDITEKELYFDLIRAQLDDYMVLLTYYNAHAEMGSSKMKEIVSRIRFFKNIDRAQLLRAEDLTLYPDSAFGTDY